MDRVPELTHDLGRLLAAIAKEGAAVPAEIQDSQMLTAYAAELRYATLDAVTDSEAEAAIRIAAAVLAWATEQTSRG